MPVEILQTHKLLATCEAALAAKLHRPQAARGGRQGRAAGVESRTASAASPAATSRPELMDKLPKLEIIANFGVGYDSIDTAAAKARNIRVTNTPNVLNDAVAEITIGLMIALARRIPQADQFVRAGQVAAAATFRCRPSSTARPSASSASAASARRSPSRAQAMKMRVVYHGRRRQPDEPFVYYDDLTDMARDVDWLVIIAPGGKAHRKDRLARGARGARPRGLPRQHGARHAGRRGRAGRAAAAARRSAARRSTCSRRSRRCPRRCSRSTTSCSRRTRAAPRTRRATRWARWSSPTSTRISPASR